MAIRKVVFPVAGLGTRFLPATKSIPKEMLPIVDRPLIQYAVNEAVAAGADTLIFVTSRKKHAIADHFDSDYELEDKLEARNKHPLLRKITDLVPRHVSKVYVTQEEALGLGHAVACARNVIGDEPFGVILADDLIYSEHQPCLAQMAAVHGHTGDSVIAVEEVPREHTGRYGVVGLAGEGNPARVRAIVEKPQPEDAPSNLAVVGRYILSPRIFELLSETEPGAGGEIQLTDAIAGLLTNADDGAGLQAFRFDGIRFDCGSKLGYLQATVHHALNHAELAEPFSRWLGEQAMLESKAQEPAQESAR